MRSRRSGTCRVCGDSCRDEASRCRRCWDARIDRPSLPTTVHELRELEPAEMLYRADDFYRWESAQ
jgi:hypothetical protein